ncbi:hypothetical protein BKA69DRAFT_846501 [Paraphysoderma sedebokerense]|nr:hypothetical protein BKA69DRAFT_846501 [Paraphysoderma sedebokerense]
MKLEQILAISAFYPLFFLFIVTYFVRPVASVFWFGHNFWLFILLFITHTISIACPALYALLRQRGSDQKMILIAHNMDSFLRVLNNKDLFQKFKHILAEDFSIENALFWEEYNALIPSNSSKTTHTILDADAARRQVQYIVNTFILPGSPHELNLSARTRKAIVQQATKNNYNTDILEPAKNEVIQLMVRKFLKTHSTDWLSG